LKGRVQESVGPEEALGVSRKNMRRNIKRWKDNQHIAMWQGLIGTQTQARKFISGPSPNANSRLLSIWRKVVWSVSSFVTVHNALRRQLYIM
jgi:hypothetical protein